MRTRQTNPRIASRISGYEWLMAFMKRVRLDDELISQGICADRADALRTLMAGLVSSGGERLTSPGLKVTPGLPLHVKGRIPYVGRGGLKLEGALDAFGIKTHFVDPDDLSNFEKEINDKTKAIYVETIGNPDINLVDIDALAEIAHSNGLLLIVDNTFASPYLYRPLEHGADVVVESATKFIGGHGTTIGGVIIDSGNFDWDAYGHKYHGLTEPDESYHGVVYTKQFGKKAYITKATTQLMRDLGSIPSPENCFLLNLGLETLPLRVERHCENAQKVAEFLDAHEKVSHVIYAGLPNDKYHELAQKYMDKGRTCGVISFELTGGRDAAVRFMDNLKLANIATHVAASKTMVLHPASHTHRQMNDEQLREAGVSPGMIRLSVGIESAKDIINDLKEALKNA